jgi:hypothetical protein
MSDVPRIELAEKLAPTLPAAWRVITLVGEADNADTTTLRLSQLTLRRIPKAPRSRSVEVVFEAVLTVPNESVAHAEDRLDDELVEWLVAVTALGLTWSEFTKTQTGEGRLGYRGELTMTAALEPKTEGD